MSLSGKKIIQIPIKSNVDVFHQIFRDRPHHSKHLCPDNIIDCKLYEGAYGSVGSVVEWHNYLCDGKYGVNKTIVTDIDEKTKLITWKTTGGPLLDVYKAIQFTVHVEKTGDENVVTWTAEYEKLDESFPDPDAYMELFVKITKDVEKEHLSLTGKRVACTGIKSNADDFNKIWMHRNHEIKKFSPKIVHACDLLEGDGNVGSLISWHYFHDGKNRVAKKIIADINDEKKSISFNLLEGDLMQLYKKMVITFHVEKSGDENSVLWTIEYEKLNDSVHDPDTLLDMFINITKDIDVGLLKPPE